MKRQLLPFCLTIVIGAYSASHADEMDIGATVGDWMREDSPSSASNDVDMFVGSVGSNNSLRGLLTFDLSGYTTSDVINDATISVFHNVESHANHKPGSATTTPVAIHLSDEIATNAVTWNSYDGTNAWASAGGDFGAALSTEIANVETIDLNDEVSFNSPALTAAIQSAVANGDSSIGFVLTAPDLEATGVRDFFAFGGHANTSVTTPNLNIVSNVPEPVSVVSWIIAALSCLGYYSLRRK